ncbi:hypothetical protein GCM10025880_01070 [Methylorubrum aminovorans]|nr:hypothetical protein GCM10025880_00190 [Methylorubrum aminovorans]GMA73690.1 hypothetical protein GCM10025880_01070 [Methylorubrum aminovorans]
MSNGAVFERAYPSDLRDGAGIRFDKFGLMATARLEYRNIAALKTSPQKGLVAIQDPDTGQFGALDFAQLPVAQPADASITNVKLGPAPGLTIKGNAVDAAAQPQDIPFHLSSRRATRSGTQSVPGRPWIRWATLPSPPSFFGNGSACSARCCGARHRKPHFPSQLGNGPSGAGSYPSGHVHI